MKKIFYLSYVAVLLASCNFNGSKDKDAAVDSVDVAVADTNAVSNNAVADSSAAVASKTKYLTNAAGTDLKMMDLFGKPQSVVIYTYAANADGDTLAPAWNTQKFTFSPAGQITSGYDANAKFTRNANGSISCVKWYVPQYDYVVKHYYTYNEDGSVDVHKYDGFGESENTKMKYNQDGVLIGESSYVNAEGEIYDDVSSYKVLASDDKRNWTKRLKETRPKGVVNSSDVSYELIVREIHY